MVKSKSGAGFFTCGTTAGPYERMIDICMAPNWGGKNTHAEALNFYPIFIPVLSVRFQVSVFRICDCVYLS
jgi:hypothetical protein